MLMTLFLVAHTLIALALVVTILLQHSEGGALGIGGSPSGLVSARGAANLLTRSTALLAGAFIITSIVLAVIAKIETGPSSEIDALLDAPTTTQAPATPATPAPAAVPLAE